MYLTQDIHVCAYYTRAYVGRTATFRNLLVECRFTAKIPEVGAGMAWRAWLESPTAVLAGSLDESRISVQIASIADDLTMIDD